MNENRAIVTFDEYRDPDMQVRSSWIAAPADRILGDLVTDLLKVEAELYALTAAAERKGRHDDADAFADMLSYIRPAIHTAIVRRGRLAAEKESHDGD